MNVPLFQSHLNKYISEIEKIINFLDDQESLTKEQIIKTKVDYQNLHAMFLEDFQKYTKVNYDHENYELQKALTDLQYLFSKNKVHLSKNPLKDDWSVKLGHAMMSMMKYSKRYTKTLF